MDAIALRDAYVAGASAAEIVARLPRRPTDFFDFTGVYAGPLLNLLDDDRYLEIKRELKRVDGRIGYYTGFFTKRSLYVLRTMYTEELAQFHDHYLIIHELILLSRQGPIAELEETIAFFCRREPDWPVQCHAPSDEAQVKLFAKHHPIFPLLSHANPDMLHRVVRLMRRLRERTS
jgi:hypothetical protein